LVRGCERVSLLKGDEDVYKVNAANEEMNLPALARNKNLLAANPAISLSSAKTGVRSP
jgi:hypothetical protein